MAEANIQIIATLESCMKSIVVINYLQTLTQEEERHTQSLNVATPTPCEEI